MLGGDITLCAHKRLLLGGTISHNDDVVKHFSIGSHLDGELGGCLDLLGLVADVGDDDGSALLNGQRKVTIKIGLRTIGRHTLLADRGTDDRLTSLVEDGSLNGQLLSKGATDR